MTPAAEFAACPTCPDAPVGPEGYCENCGRKVPAAADHCELNLGGLVAGVTDRGLRHRRNEDAMALATADTADGPIVVAVVCDGISTSSRPDEAATAAAQAAVTVLFAAATAGDDLAVASKQAVSAAQEALLQLAAEDAAANAPATTFVSAVISGAEVTICWTGDSRAYWLTDQAGAESRQLTTDDSIAQELVSEGLLTASQAMASPAGHVVTGWLGADLTDVAPHVMAFRPREAGVVLLCSDGLWNYQPAAEDLAASILPGALTDPLSAAAALVSFAIESGGSDNITAVLAPFSPRGEPDHQDEPQAQDEGEAQP